MRLLLVLSLLLSQRVQTHLITDEADAVLSILAKRAAHEAITDADWNRVFTSEGYVRLQKREHSMKREFENDAFKKFVMSDELLAKREMLAKTVADWSKADLTEAAVRRCTAFYYASISEIDEQVGRMLALLKSKGLYQNTLIIYTSDHGEYLGFHHQLLKSGQMYDPA